MVMAFGNHFAYALASRLRQKELIQFNLVAKRGLDIVICNQAEGEAFTYRFEKDLKERLRLKREN